MATTPRGIVTPDSGDPYNYIVDLATMADTIDDAIGDVDVSADIPTIQNDISALQTATGVKNYRWADATERAAQTGMEEGDRGYQEDTGVEYWYSGSEWLVNLPGLNLIVPESVTGTGATVNNRGVVTLASATSFSLNGVFTSRFRDYRIVFDLSGTATATFVLRASGSNATSAYDRQVMFSQGSNVTGSQVLNQSSTLLIPSGLTARTVGSIDVFGPALAAPTLMVNSFFETANPMTASDVLAGTLGTQHRTATAYDGFTISPSSGSLTGTIRVYGYNE